VNEPSRQSSHIRIGTRFLLALLCACFFVGTACRKAEPTGETQNGGSSAAWFEDVTERTGIKFKHEIGEKGKFFMPETVGSGAALFDYDNDGRLDVYLIQNAGAKSKAANQLFHQEPDGRFSNVSDSSGLDVTGFGMGVAVGDVNNDGLPDVLVTEYQGARLFLNMGQGKFREITRESGIEDSHWAISAAFFDYDRDGWLDLVVVNYIDYLETEKCFDRAGKPEYCGPNSRPGTVTQLFHNLGAKSQGTNGARFAEVTVPSGLGMLPGPGLGVLCADFNGDGWPDILVANDAKPNTLWINAHDGSFKNEAGSRGIAYNEMGTAQANMGIAFGDIAGSGLFSVYITHLSEENNVLWLQDQPGLFQDRTSQAGLANTKWHATGFGTAFGDFDHDGFPDLALVNGRVRRASDSPGMASAPALGEHWSAYGERNQLFANSGKGQFREISQQDRAFCGEPNVGRGLACGDIDGDGALDLLVTAVDAPARVYRNVAPKRGHWLMVKAVDPGLGGRDAYGARVSVVTNGKSHVGWINPGYSYACSNDPRAHFGLGESARAESIRVLWPDGKEEEFGGTAVDKVVTLSRGGGKFLK
jgi:hypothetical protein